MYNPGLAGLEFVERTRLNPGSACLEFGERTGQNLALEGLAFRERTRPNPGLELGPFLSQNSKLLQVLSSEKGLGQTLVRQEKGKFLSLSHGRFQVGRKDSVKRTVPGPFSTPNFCPNPNRNPNTLTLTLTP